MLIIGSHMLTLGVMVVTVMVAFFKECELGKRVRDNIIDILDDVHLTNQDTLAKCLNTYLMRPFPGKQLSDDKLVFN